MRNETALLPVCVPTHARRGHHADENELRKSFTVTERLAIAQRIAERLGMRQGQRTDLPTSGNISLSEAGQTRDLAAAKAGLGSGKTLEAAQKVVEHGTPELVAMPQTWVMAQICVIRQGYPKAGDPARLEHLILKLRANNYRKPGNQVSSNGGNVIRAAAGELCLRCRNFCIGP